MCEYLWLRFYRTYKSYQHTVAIPNNFVCLYRCVIGFWNIIRTVISNPSLPLSMWWVFYSKFLYVARGVELWGVKSDVWLDKIWFDLYIKIRWNVAEIQSSSSDCTFYTSYLICIHTLFRAAVVAFLLLCCSLMVKAVWVIALAQLLDLPHSNHLLTSFYLLSGSRWNLFFISCTIISYKVAIQKLFDICSRLKACFLRSNTKNISERSFVILPTT